MKRIFIKILKIVAAIILALGLIGFILLRQDRSTDGFEQFETEHFSIYYKQLKPSTLDDMEIALESNYQKSSDFFKVYTAKTKIVIYDNVDEFQRKAYGLAISWYLKDWAVGGAAEDSIYMTSPEAPDASHTYESMLEILTHEFVHTQAWQVNPDIDIWLNEGLAVYFAAQKRVINRDFPSYETMQEQDGNAFGEAGGYLFGYYYVEYLFENFQREQVFELVKTGDFEASLGKSKRQIYDEWIAAMTQKP